MGVAEMAIYHTYILNASHTKRYDSDTYIPPRDGGGADGGVGQMSHDPLFDPLESAGSAKSASSARSAVAADPRSPLKASEP